MGVYPVHVSPKTDHYETHVLKKQTVQRQRAAIDIPNVTMRWTPAGERSEGRPKRSLRRTVKGRNLPWGDAS